MEINWQEVKQEASGYLSQLVQLNTTNPPGYEMLAIQFLKSVAERNGLYTTIQTTGEQRGNIIISLESTYENPTILLSHVDVVPADEADWDVHPFSGAIIEDTLWGRGTIDTKQLTITHLMILILLRRNNISFGKKIVMVATADEENGSKYGLLALLKTEGALFTNATVFNEGGGFPIALEGQNYYLAEMGQKGVARFKLTVVHQQGDNPYMPSNAAMQTIMQVIQQVMNANITEPLPHITEMMFQTICKRQGIAFDKDDLTAFFNQIPEHLVTMFKAMTKTTFSITKWNGGRKHPSLKGSTEIIIDCRTLPFVDEGAVKSYIEELIKGLPVDYDLFQFSQGYETKLNDQMLKLFEQNLQGEVKDAVVVPYLSIGSSDGRHLLPYQSKVYGYCPMLPDMSFDKVIKMVHGVNEKIPLESLRFGILNMYNILLSIGKE